MLYNNLYILSEVPMPGPPMDDTELIRRYWIPSSDEAIRSCLSQMQVLKNRQMLVAL